MRIWGARDVLPKGAKFPVGSARIRVRFGPVIPPQVYDPGKEHPERFLEASRRILEIISNLPECREPGL